MKPKDVKREDQATRTEIVTWWFRSPETWATLRSEILPRFDRPRIWSGACGTGEEAYAAAIAATKVDGTVIGTDINAGILETAKTGTYQVEDIAEFFPAIGRVLPVSEFLAHLDVSKATGEARIVGTTRERVEFHTLDLRRDSTPDCDVAILANMWRHLDAEDRRALVGRLRSALSPDGRLVTGYADEYSSADGMLSDTGAHYLDEVREHFEPAEYDTIWRLK